MITEALGGTRLSIEWRLEMLGLRAEIHARQNLMEQALHDLQDIAAVAPLNAQQWITDISQEIPYLNPCR